MRALVAPRGSLLCAIVDAGARDPIELARHARDELLAEHRRDVRAAASRAASAQALRRSFHEARCALEAVRFANGDAPEVASHARPRLVPAAAVAAGRRGAAARTATACSRALAEGDADYGDELLRSLEAFLEHNGHWERAAARSSSATATRCATGSAASRSSPAAT